MHYILSLEFLEKMYHSEKICVGKVKNTYIYLVAKLNSNKNGKDLLQVSWYHNKTSSPDLRDQIHFVDVLDLVSEEVSKELIFNMNLFSCKGD